MRLFVRRVKALTLESRIASLPGGLSCENLSFVPYFERTGETRKRQRRMDSEVARCLYIMLYLLVVKA